MEDSPNYLTMVQGMPAHIEEKLEKREQKFIWEGKTKNLVNLELSKAPKSQGGLDILDISARIKSINLMWVKSLLIEERPRWTFFANDILARAELSAERNIPKEIKSNIFLQLFNAKIQYLPKDLAVMLKTAKEVGLRPEGIAFSRQIMRQMQTPVYACQTTQQPAVACRAITE